MEQRRRRLNTAPEEAITLNQVVALNIAYYRRKAGITQEDLAARLGAISGEPWSKTTVSAAERSAFGARVRQFDANDLLSFAVALEVPIVGLLMPPDTDGEEQRFRITPATDGPWQGITGGALMHLVFPEPGDEQANVETYFERRIEANRLYYGTAQPRTDPLGKELAAIEEDQRRLLDAVRRVRTSVEAQKGRGEE